MAVFWLILAMFLFSHPSHVILMLLRTRSPFGCRMNVQNFMEIVWTVFEKFEIFIERSREKKNKKRYDCIIFSDSSNILLFENQMCITLSV